MNQKEKIVEATILALQNKLTESSSDYMMYVDDWKAKELESYLEQFDKQMQYIDELNAKCEEHNWDLYTLEAYRKIPMIFKQFRFNRNKEQFKELAMKEIDKHFKSLQQKVEKVIGNIIKIVPYGNNGYDYNFIGEKGNCAVEVILAGGYNIQRLHTRWIIKK